MVGSPSPNCIRYGWFWLPLDASNVCFGLLAPSPENLPGSAATGASLFYMLSHDHLGEYNITHIYNIYNLYT